jgi:spermidine synthase
LYYRIVCAAIFFLSGTTSLTFQVAWRRILSQEIGVDYAAVTFTVAIFITGLGLGGIVGGGISRTWAHRPRWLLVAAYAACEILIGAYGLLSEPLLRWIGVASARAGLHDVFALFCCYLLALLPPTVAMGATLPLMLQVGSRLAPRLGAAIGLLYGVNIFGAAVGALVADFYFLELFGIRQTLSIASLMNLIFPIVFLLLVGWRYRGATLQHDRPVPTVADAGLIALSSLFGFVTLSLEMILFRVTAHYLQNDAYAFSIMLFCYLMMMCAGNFVFGALTDRVAPERLIVPIAFGFFVSVLVALNAREILEHLYPASTIRVPGRLGGATSDLDKIVAVSVIMLPVFFVSGLFPCMIRMLSRDPSDIGHSTGRVYFAFSLGNGVGVAATGLLIVPFLGTINAIRLVIALTALGTVALLERGKAGRGVPVSLGPAIP